MLLTNFYTVISLESTGANTHLAHIRVNAQHEVFKGHFPGNPVMPGVCMMQIIKEIAETICGCTLRMQSMSNVKFMALINPDVNPELRLELDVNYVEDGSLKLKNTTYFADTAALKLSAVYKKV